MTYSVVWMSALEPELTRLYLQARADGVAEAVTRATAGIDRRLAASPATEGESRTGVGRVLSEGPLWVDFEVHDEQRVVIVTAVRYFRPRSQ